MKSLRLAVLIGAVVMLAVPALQDTAQAKGKKKGSLSADLNGFAEVPAVSTTGSGALVATVGPDGASLEYELSFQDLEGDVTQAHIHIGQTGVNGGVAIWLCGTAASHGPAGTPGCGGPRSGTASRTVFAADVIGPAGQGVAPGEFAEALNALRAGVAYANVHSTRNPGGEIRGQVGGGDKDDDSSDD